MPGAVMPDTSLLRKRCERILQETKELVGDTKITIDATVVPRLLGLTRLLISHGFSVERIFYGCFFGRRKRRLSLVKRKCS